MLRCIREINKYERRTQTWRDYWRELKDLFWYCFQIIAVTKKERSVHITSHHITSHTHTPSMEMRQHELLMSTNTMFRFLDKLT